MKAGVLHKCLVPPTALEADMTVCRRQHRCDSTEHIAETRYAFIIEVLKGAIAIERESMNQEKQRSVEKRLVDHSEAGFIQAAGCSGYRSQEPKANAESRKARSYRRGRKRLG